MSTRNKRPEAAAAAEEAVEAVEEKTEAIQEAPAAEEEKKPEPLMYVGPTIYGVATQNTVYTGMPPMVETARKSFPEIVHLFIPIADFYKAQTMIATGTGYIGQAYRHGLEFADRVRKGGLK